MFFAIQQKREPEVRSALVSQTEIGGTFITLAAIDSMVQKHIRQNNRVRDCVTAVRAAQDGVVLSARLTVLPDTQLVELTGALQKSLKEYIRRPYWLFRLSILDCFQFRMCPLYAV